MLKHALPAVLLAASASRAAAACDGVVSTFAGACTLANFEAHLADGCTLDELFPQGEEGAPTAADAVAHQCAYGAPVRFERLQGTYQLDRRYFAGGGPLVDGARPAVDRAPLRRFDANLADDTLVAFPEYAARVQYNINEGHGTNGYPANMNLETGCDLNTIMCCFTEGDFAGEEDATTDVCHHDLENSQESNHINRGWSAFPGSEASTHCTGFTWKEGEDELLGNMMYDVSLRNSANKLYVKGVPGAPMCGCIEHMPVVETAACRTASKTTEITYTFTYKPGPEGAYGDLQASNAVGIAYAACAASDLKAQFVADNADDADRAARMDDHLVGAGGCAAGVGDYLNAHFVAEGQDLRYEDPDPNLWSDLVAGQGIFFLPPDHGFDAVGSAADAEFRDLIDNKCKDSAGNDRHCIVRRKCASCYNSHVDIYYQRLTPLPAAAGFNFLKVFLTDWFSAENLLNVDFALYSTYEDARDGTDAWTYCNYDDGDIGFPRDCGPTGHVSYNWNSIKKSSPHAKHNGFFVERPELG